MEMRRVPGDAGISARSAITYHGSSNLRDITLDPNFSALCGYTETDLDQVFAAELSGLDRPQIKRRYNGYNWTGDAVYNPFDVLLLFENRKFQPWWYETGVPEFLVKLLAERGLFTPNLANLYTAAELLSTFDVDQTQTEALLFQTGYLTILREEQDSPGMVSYVLGYPNLAVEGCLNASLRNLPAGDASKSHQQRHFPAPTVAHA